MKRSVFWILMLVVPATTIAQTREDPYSGPNHKNNSSIVSQKSRQTEDELLAYSEYDKYMPSILPSEEFRCYLPDYFKEWFVNGKRIPGAPRPHLYCMYRREADVKAGVKVALTDLYIERQLKAQEEYEKNNPDPWREEWRKATNRHSTNESFPSKNEGKK
jgi:hypothetical protein